MVLYSRPTVAPAPPEPSRPEPAPQQTDAAAEKQARKRARKLQKKHEVEAAAAVEYLVAAAGFADAAVSAELAEAAAEDDVERATALLVSGSAMAAELAVAAARTDSMKIMHSLPETALSDEALRCACYKDASSDSAVYLLGKGMDMRARNARGESALSMSSDELRDRLVVRYVAMLGRGPAGAEVVNDIEMQAKAEKADWFNKRKMTAQLGLARHANNIYQAEDRAAAKYAEERRVSGLELRRLAQVVLRRRVKWEAAPAWEK